MKIRFWGTRGSLPISLTAPDVRAKLIAALTGAVGRSLSTPEEITNYVDNELGFEVRGTFGGHSSCVELVTAGAEHVIFDMGSGARPLGQAMLKRFELTTADLSHLHVARALGSHHGLPFFAPVYIPATVSSYTAATVLAERFAASKRRVR
jgi:hypothetical protein